MKGSQEKKRSRYMEWAKTRSHAKFNLATSGMMSLPLAEFPWRSEELELTAAGNYGYEPLRQRLARHTGAPEECIVTATGTSMANHLAMAAVLERGDEVLMEEPAYGPLLDVAIYLGARVRRILRRMEDGFGVDAEKIKRLLKPRTRLIVLTNLHNPSGALISPETMRAIGELAARGGAHVLVDEVYLEMLFGRGVASAFSIGQEFGGVARRGSPGAFSAGGRKAPMHGGKASNPFIVTSSLTKVYGLSGLRCGWALAEPELARRMLLLNDLFGASAVHIAERLSVTALDHFEPIGERARRLLETNRALLDAFLDSRRDLECFRPPAGTVVFPRLRRGKPGAFFTLLREKYETSVVPGEFFEMPRHFRLGIGGETTALRAGLERLAAALDEFGRGRASTHL